MTKPRALAARKLLADFCASTSTSGAVHVRAAHDSPRNEQSPKAVSSVCLRFSALRRVKHR